MEYFSTKDFKDSRRIIGQNSESVEVSHWTNAKRFTPDADDSKKPKPTPAEIARQHNYEMLKTLDLQLHRAIWDLNDKDVGLVPQLEKYNTALKLDSDFARGETVNMQGDNVNLRLDGMMQNIDFLIELGDSLLKFKQRYMRAREE